MVCWWEVRTCWGYNVVSLFKCCIIPRTYSQQGTVWYYHVSSTMFLLGITLSIMFSLFTCAVQLELSPTFKLNSGIQVLVSVKFPTL